MERRKKLILLLTICLCQIVANAAKVNTLTIYFAKDKYIVTGDEGQKLYALKNADLIMLHGHTDIDGSTAYNDQLSANRVSEVQRIVTQLCPQARIETKHYGEYQPINTNEDEVAKTANRRVEVSYIVDPLLSTKVPVQSFTIDTRKDQTITCKQGTQVAIPAGAFAEASVTINISEYYDPLQIFAANLSTHSDNSPIETAGMIYITAEANGKNVEPNKELIYKFPRSNQQKDFYLFEGDRDSAYDMNWVLVRKPKDTADINTELATVQEKLLAINRVKAEKVKYLNEVEFGSLLLTTHIDGAEREEVAGMRTLISQGYAEDKVTGVGDYFRDAEVYINVNADGRITAVTTSYTNKNTENDRALQLFVQKVTPKRFKPADGDTKITLKFRSRPQPQPWQAFHCRTPLTEAEKAKYETEKIVFSSANLGWMNCDRFLGNVAKTTYAVKCEPEATVRMAVDKYKSFFTSTAAGNLTNGKDTVYQFSFYNVPIDEPVTLISTKSIDGKVYLAIIKTKVKRGLDEALAFNYKQVSRAELEGEIKKLRF